MKFYITIAGAIIVLLFSYFVYLLSIISEGYYQGYLEKEVDTGFTDFYCFYKNIDLTNIYSIMQEAKLMKQAAYDLSTLENAINFIKTVNNIKSQIVKECIEPLKELIDKREKEGSSYKNVAYKFLSYVPYGDGIKVGLKTIELAKHLKELVDLAYSIKNIKLDSEFHINLKNISSGIARLTYSMESIMNINNIVNDLDLIKGIFQEINSVTHK